MSCESEEYGDSELMRNLRMLRELREIKKYSEGLQDPNAQPPEERWESYIH